MEAFPVKASISSGVGKVPVRSSFTRRKNSPSVVGSEVGCAIDPGSGRFPDQYEMRVPAKPPDHVVLPWQIENKRNNLVEITNQDTMTARPFDLNVETGFGFDDFDGGGVGGGYHHDLGNDGFGSVFPVGLSLKGGLLSDLVKQGSRCQGRKIPGSWVGLGRTRSDPFFENLGSGRILREGDIATMVDLTGRFQEDEALAGRLRSILRPSKASTIVR